jgi:hypothetical protein
LFLNGRAVVFVVQLADGLELIAHPGNSGDVNTIAILVVCCFLIRDRTILGADRGAVDRHHARGYRDGPAHDRGDEYGATNHRRDRDDPAGPLPGSPGDRADG